MKSYFEFRYIIGLEKYSLWHKVRGSDNFSFLDLFHYLNKLNQLRSMEITLDLVDSENEIYQDNEGTQYRNVVKTGIKSKLNLVLIIEDL